MISLDLLKVTIRGRGFGLYGYLPALAKMPNVQIFLPIEYKEFLLSRDELKDHIPDIQWFVDADEILKNVDAVIIAISPELQVLEIDKYLKYQNIKYLALEKPLAASPHESAVIFEKLILSGKQFRIGYNFRWTEWGQTIINQKTKINSISWNFKAHHFLADKKTWKIDHAVGGGVVRFYGIHVIAFLAELNYKTVIDSRIFTNKKGDYVKWIASIENDDKEVCVIKVDSDSPSQSFEVSYNGNHLVNLSDPFELKRNEPEDRRVVTLGNSLKDLFNNKQIPSWYKQTLVNWQSFEEYSGLF